MLGLLACWSIPALSAAQDTIAEEAAAGGRPVTSAGHLLNAELALERREFATAARELTAAALLSDDPGVADRAARFTFGVGFDGYAEQVMAHWVTLAPGNPLPHELLGRLKLRRHALDAAVVDLAAALGPGEPRRDEIYLALAADLASEDNARLVTRALARLAAQDPLAPGLQLGLGNAALRSGDYELALAAAASAASDDPEWLEPRLLRARALAGIGRHQEAQDELAALGELTGNPLVSLEAARLLATAGDPDEARRRLAALEQQYGARPEIVRTLALLALGDGDLDAADERFDALDSEGPERFEAFYYRGQIAARRGDGEAARAYFARISSGSYLVPAQLSIAETLARDGDPAAAVLHLKSFARDYPTQAFASLEFRAQLEQQLDRTTEALATYTEALEYKPSAISILMARGAVLDQLGRIEEALADLKLAVTIAPDDATALNAYGYTLANRTRRSREAWRYVRLAYEMEPGNAAIQDSVGWTLFRLRRPGEARSHLEEAYQRLPDPEVASHLAEVSWALGDRAAARELLREAEQTWPDSEIVQDTVRRLRL